MDTAAAAMAHDDDIGDVQRLDGEFDAGRGAVLAAVRLVGRHEIGDVAEHEELARAGIEDHLGCRATVAAGDDHRGWLLAGAGKVADAFLLALVTPGHEVGVAVEEMLREPVHDLSISGMKREDQSRR